MEDKSFELLTQLYKELSAFRKETNSRFEEANRRFEEAGRRLDKLELILVNEIKPDIKIALEGYHDVSEKLTMIDKKIDNLTTKVEGQDVQITVLKGGKQSAR